ncbi:MAG: hypothetical protein WEC33_04710 [Dehalococcoidia bacterium]
MKTMRSMLPGKRWIPELVGYGAMAAGFAGGGEALVGIGFAVVLVAWPIQFVRWRRARKTPQIPATIRRIEGRRKPAKRAKAA